MTIAPPFRSMSHVRGDNIGEVEEARHIGLDAMYIDMEEPSTPMTEADRVAMRVELGAWMRAQPRASGGATRLFIRVQPAQSGEMHKDLDAVACEALEVILLPKVEGPEEIWAADAVATAVELDHGLAPGSILFYPILETAQALRRAYDIVAASPRVAYMGGAVSRFGDIVQSTGFVWTTGGRETFMFRSWVLTDVRAAGMAFPVTGGSSVGDGDGDVVRRWAEEGRALGYRGSQIRCYAPHVAIVNEVYSPTADELADWRRLVEAADAGTLSADLATEAAQARVALSWAAEKGLAG